VLVGCAGLVGLSYCALMIATQVVR